MARDPIIQFDTRSWLTDPQLRLTSPSTRGIWMDLLCFMRVAPKRGVIHGTIEQLMMMVGANEEQITLFINEARFTNFADVTICHDIVTVCNRRMVRDEKVKEASRVRQQKHRVKKAENENVTDSTVEVEGVNNKVTTEKQEKKKITYCWERHGYDNVTREDIDLWRKAYPAINVESEIRKAEAWQKANPKNRKTNCERFLNGWMSRAQDQAPPVRDGTPIPKARKYTQRCDKCDQLVEETVDRRGMKVCITCCRAMDPELDRKALEKLNNIMAGSTCLPSH